MTGIPDEIKTHLTEKEIGEICYTYHRILGALTYIDIVLSKQQRTTLDSLLLKEAARLSDDDESAIYLRSVINYLRVIED